MSSLVNTDITSLLGMLRAPCLPHACSCQINFDIPQITDSLQNFRWEIWWGRNSQSILQSKVLKRGEENLVERTLLHRAKGFKQLHNLAADDNHGLKEGDTKSNDSSSDSSVSHTEWTRVECSQNILSCPHPLLSVN